MHMPLLSRLETYFKRRNYPVDILTEALQKASNLTIEEALKYSSSEKKQPGYFYTTDAFF